MDNDKVYTVPEMAKEFDMTERAIRFYESKGLLFPKRAGKTRVFSYKDHARLIIILRGKRLGFSLNEIHEMIDLYDAGPTEGAQLKIFIHKLRERRKLLEHRRNDINSVISEIREREQQCQKLLRKQ